MEETRVREIIREEIRAAFQEMHQAADRQPSYDSDHIEDVAARIIGSVAESTADQLAHTIACEKRTGDDYYVSFRACTC